MRKLINKIFFNKSLILIAILFLLYCISIIKTLQLNLDDLTYSLGYLDFQNNWRGLDEIVHGRLIYKDFYFEYGWFFLFFQSIFYRTVGANFFSLILSRHLFFPILGVIVSFIIAKIFFNNHKYLIIIFLFFLLLFCSNFDFVSLRHLISELSLAFFILGYLKKNFIYIWTSGIIAGLSILTATEYGIALNITIILTSLFLSAKDKNLFGLLIKFIISELLVLLPFVFVLINNHILNNFLSFNFGFANNFYYASPCSGDSFPRFEDIKLLANSSKYLIFGIPIEFLQKLNLYIIPIVFFICFCFSIYKSLFSNKYQKISMLLGSLSLYGALIYARTLDTPCVGYFTYGLVPFFILATLFIKFLFDLAVKQKGRARVSILVIILIIFGWFFLTKWNSYFFDFNNNQLKKSSEKQELVFLKEAGCNIQKQQSEDYRQIIEYINNNSNSDDYVYVYPWGPYNNFTLRKYPTKITNAAHFLAGEKFVIETMNDLITNKPRIVVVNIYNSLGVAHYGIGRGDVYPFYPDIPTEGPVFSGKGNIIERFILENYRTVFANNVGVVMVLKTAAPFNTNFTVEENKKTSVEYSVEKKGQEWIIIPDNKFESKYVSIYFLFNDSILMKHFSRYIIEVSLLAEDNSIIKKNITLATKDWQIIEFYLTKPMSVNKLQLKVIKNNGFLWMIKAEDVLLKDITYY